MDAANPRANNTMGHIIQWTEDDGFDATGFRWKRLQLACDPAIGEVRRFLTGSVGFETTGHALNWRSIGLGRGTDGSTIGSRHDQGP